MNTPIKRTYDWPFIYFAHIGKTGGTSVRHAAFKHFGEDRCVCLYAEGRSANTGGAFEIFTATMEETGKPRAAAMKVLDLLEDKRPAFFSTHNPMFGRFIPAEKTVAFFREPVDRAISEYNFWKNLGREIESFEAYALDPGHANKQSTTVRNIDIDQIAVVGITSEHEASIAMVNRQFGVELPTLRSNKTSWRPWKVKRSALSADLIRQIENLNADDMAIYDRAKVRFERDVAAG